MHPAATSAKRVSLLLVAFVGAAGAHAADPRGAEVWVRAEHRGGEIVYQYEIRNREATRLDRFALGCDCRVPGEIVAGAQLSVLPTATTVVDEDYRGHVLEPPPGSLVAPPGWRATVRAPRGEPWYWIEWRTFDPAAAIPVNQSLKGFAVAVPVADPSLLTGGYLVADASAGQAQGGRVRPADIGPPRLSVQLHIRGAGDPEGTIAVATEVSVSDDVDPEPRVHLESFVREGPQEGEAGTSRLALTYRATDASGNTSRETARIALPGALAGVVGLPGAGILP